MKGDNWLSTGVASWAIFRPLPSERMLVVIVNHGTLERDAELPVADARAAYADLVSRGWEKVTERSVAKANMSVRRLRGAKKKK